MFIVLGIIGSLIISAIEIFAFCKKKSAGTIINIILQNGFAVPLVSLWFLTRVFKYQHFLVTDAYGPMNFFKFFGLSLVVGLVILFIKAVVFKYITFEEETPKKSKGAMALKIFALIFFALGLACYFGTNWAKGNFGDVAGDQLFITLFSPTEGTELSVYIDGFEGPMFMVFLLSTLFGLVNFSKFKLAYHGKRNKVVTIYNNLAHRIVCFVLAVAMLAGGVTYGVQKFQLKQLFNAYVIKSGIIDDNYVDPQTAEMKFPEKKRNLIHIYLESMENSFMDKENGGFMDENMMPELTELAREGISFSNRDHQFGGPQSAVGTTWSVASMVNMMTGLPMKAPADPNAYGSPDNFLPGAYTLTEILADQGYEQTVMFGSDANFGGLSYLYQSHGNPTMLDWRGARAAGLIPDDYRVWWGYEDDKLYEFAKDELTRLASTGKPFNFTMETADTHRPDGYLSPNAETPYENQYANVVRYSTAETVKFVRWIQQQPFYENTTIILIGDHLSMETNFYEFYNFTDDYQRTQFNLILNPAPNVANISEARTFNRIYANYDYFPTILASLGVEIKGDRLGVGTNLFSKKDTIFEEYGFEFADNEMSKKSEVYNTQILVDPDAPAAE